MTRVEIHGHFSLMPGVRLIGDAKGGVILRDDPLRAIRINGSAFEILEKCRQGFSFQDWNGSLSGSARTSMVKLLDRLCETGLMEWTPPEDPYEPSVSLIVAVYNRAGEIGACLDSLLSLEYPRSGLEIIVVDDGSRDGTCDVVSAYDVKLIVHPENRGQSAARNRGAKDARGDIIAFVDSDCIATPEWLRDLVPYFRDERNVLVGGYVASFYTESLLDRYEEVQSPLNMGEETVVGAGVESDFYVPTCNMLVRRDTYLEVGGLNEDMRVGEDVDLCWRLKEHGHRLVYVPKGVVRHKHRNRLLEGFTRRFQYGESEPELYLAHRSIAKHYPWQPLCMVVLGLCIAALVTREVLFLPAIAVMLIAEVFLRKDRYERLMNVTLTARQVLRAVAEKHVLLTDHLCRHVVRYYLPVLGALAIIIPQAVPVVIGVILLPSAAQYFRKKPRLNFGTFLLFFLAEQAFYQTGVLWACLRLRSFRPYRLVFTGVRGRPRSGMVCKTARI
ncbi:MAG: mycofactocin biosynthesis glycosyltransferase MftF [Desulfomonilaceae bacterium]|nr:mycofactocin biosynthesis glycosyltransferase MftF [Desulfomonilaceae bacterium]